MPSRITSAHAAITLLKKVITGSGGSVLEGPSASIRKPLRLAKSRRFGHSGCSAALRPFLGV
jgi:hypothetical protein